MYRSFDKSEDDFMTSEEGLKRCETFRRRNEHPEERPPISIDHHGLIWNDNKILVNLFQCLYMIRKAEKLNPLPDNSLGISEYSEEAQKS